MTTVDKNVSAAVDHILVDVMWIRLLSIVDEQASIVKRTAFSPVAREAGDLSAGIFDLSCNMIAQSVTGTPGHINALPACLRYMISEFPIDTLKPGDVLVTNDPYKNCGHQYDFTIATPIFKNANPVAICASTLHVLDIGGRPLSAEGRDVFEEGLIIPAFKLYSEGSLNETLVRIIRANVRTPDEVMGDINALVGANDISARRLIESLEELGLDSIDDISSEIIFRSEKSMRDTISKIPEGTYKHQILLDEADGEPIRIAIAIEVKGSDLHIDYTGTSPKSKKGINVVYNYTNAYTIYSLKCAIAPDVPNNDGSFRPVHVYAPPGSLFNAQPPSPIASRHVMGHSIPGAVYGALGQAVPDKVISEGAGAVWYTTVSGVTDEGKNFLTAQLSAGGMGARPNKDGLSCTGFPTGSVTVPTEITESLAPVLYHKRELIIDSGGPGKFRGGLGQVMEIQVLAKEPHILTSSTERTQYSPQGMAGGKPGTKGDLRTTDGKMLKRKEANYLTKEEIAVIQLPGAGGFFPPYERDPQLVLSDVIEGYVSIESAKRDYGVVIDSNTMTVKERATAKLRRNLSS